MAARDHLGGGQSGTHLGSAATGGPQVPTSGAQHQQHHHGPSTRGGRTAADPDPYGTGGRGGAQHQRTSRRDQLARQEGGPVDRSPPHRPGGGGYGVGGGVGGGFGGPGPVRGSPAGAGRRPVGTGRGAAATAAGPSRSFTTSPLGQYPDEFRNVPQSISASAFNVGGVYRDGHDPMMDRTMGDPRMDRGLDRGMDRGMDHHRSTSMPAGPGMHSRSRSASRGLPGSRGPGYHSLDREGYNDRDFMPIREPRERSLDRDWALSTGATGYGSGPYGGRRDRSLDRRVDPMLDVDDGLGYVRDPMVSRRTGLSPNPVPTVLGARGGDPFLTDLQHSNAELQRELANLKKELEVTNQKLGSSMHSIKTFWSPELKKERALRKEESAKYSLINDQLKLLNSENQVRVQGPLYQCVHTV